MSQSSPSLPPQKRGGGKYALLGILLLLCAVAGVWWASRDHKEPEVAAKPVKAAEPESRRPALDDSEIVIPDEKKEEAAPAQKKKIVYRYVKEDWSECTGELSAAQAQAVINSNRRQVRSCYERRLKVDNNLQGTVNVKLKIASGGQVTAALVGGSLRDKDVFECVKSLAKTWRFPSPAGGACAVISAPFSMTPLNP